MEPKEVMKSISESLGMAPLVVGELVEEQEAGSTDMVPVPDEPELTIEEKQAEEDFAIARENVKDILEKGSEALHSILRIAEASEHPRAFEVAANLIKTLTDSNKSLLDLHEQRRQLAPIAQEEKKEDPTQITNNNVFVGTTAELLDLIKQGKNPYDNGKLINGGTSANSG
jgi:hypothetical protein